MRTFFFRTQIVPLFSCCPLLAIKVLKFVHQVYWCLKKYSCVNTYIYPIVFFTDICDHFRISLFSFSFPYMLHWQRTQLRRMLCPLILCEEFMQLQTTCLTVNCSHIRSRSPVSTFPATCSIVIIFTYIFYSVPVYGTLDSVHIPFLSHWWRL